jgi:PilZ domain
MKLIRTLGVGAGLFNGRRGVRICADAMDASYPTELERKSVRVKDVSPTGVYIFTDDRWAIGTSISLTLKKWSLLDKSPEPSIRVYAKTVRHGSDGVGMVFLFESIDTAAWLNVLGEATPLIEQRDAMSMLRVTRALAFLCRICPARETESLRFILDELAFESGARALDILVTAEELVSRRGYPTRADVSSAVICRILLEGSKINMAWIRHLWAGLLAAASLQDANDEKSEEYAALFSQLDIVQIHMLAASCTKSGNTSNGSGNFLLHGLAYTAEQMQWITGVSDLNQIERGLDHLYQLGLIEQTIKRDPFGPIEVVNLTPTRTGLTLYAKCKGQLQTARDSESSDQMSLFAAESSSRAATNVSRVIHAAAASVR